MAIEDILASLDIQADAEIRRIRERSDAEVDAIESAAQEKAQAVADAYIAEVVGEQKIEAEREVYAESTEHRRLLADVRRNVFEEVFDLASKRIETIRERDDYPQILERLVNDAVAHMGPDYVLHVDPRDKQLVSEVCQGVACAADITTAGGVIVTFAGGRIRRSSTFEDRLQRIREDRIEEISEVLNQ